MEYIGVFNQNYHLQGFTSDTEHKYMFWSFTDSLVKTSISGTVIAQVHIGGGHLGDIDYYDGKIYGTYLGNALPGHKWDDWTAFKVYVFDAEDLKLIDVITLKECEEYFKVSGKPEDTRGLQGVDGITFGKDAETGERKMQIACGLITGEKYANQIILQYSLDGKYEKEYYIHTGNTVYGIQNLDYDEETGHYWFMAYNSEKPFQAKDTLYCVDRDFKTVLAQYHFSTPYGFDCIGGANTTLPCNPA